MNKRSALVQALLNLAMSEYGGDNVEIIPLNVTANGTYNAPEGNAYNPVTVNISGVEGKNDVNFYDYDGTIVKSYSATEFADLAELPDNPSHAGLTAQGWNWTLTDAKTYVASYGKLDVGQMYITDDGKTRLYIHLEDGRLTPYLGIAINGSAMVNWGDGTSDTITGTDTTTVVSIQHTYTMAGDYVIAISVSGSMALLGASNYGSQVLWKNHISMAYNYAYQNAIQKVEIGANTSIGAYAFQNCRSLATITLPTGITSIELQAFYSCYSITHLTLPSGLTSIGEFAFYCCYSLLSISLPSGMTNISASVFYGCPSLTSVTIPSGVTTLGSYLFNGCTALTSVTIPNGVTSIEANAFNSCTALASITIPNSVTSIGASAFYQCASLPSITIPSGVTSISDSIFRNCYSIRSVTMPSEVTNISSSAFYSCSSLTSITIPDSVTNIGASAFRGCYCLGYIRFTRSTPPTVSNSNAWTNVPSDCIIYVPSGSLAAYTGATNYPSSSTYTYVEY